MGIPYLSYGAVEIAAAGSLGRRPPSNPVDIESGLLAQA